MSEFDGMVATFSLTDISYELINLVIGPYSEPDVRLPNGLWDDFGWRRAMARAFVLGVFR